MKNRDYYLGLDIGTNSVGYAVTDEEYNILKFHGVPAWGTHAFDEGKQCAERRQHRTARRTLDRRQQRVDFLREIFAKEINKVDPRFYIREIESNRFRDNSDDKYMLFNENGFSDKEYYEKYPTIHHLIVDLIYNKEPHDVRLVYLACAWLVAHRGNFLSNISVNNLSEIRNFETVYNNFMSFFSNEGWDSPWKDVDIEAFSKTLQSKTGVNNKYKQLVEILYLGEKPSKIHAEEFPFNRELITKLIAGGKVKVKDLYFKEEYDELGSVALSDEDEKLLELIPTLGDDYLLIEELRKIYDWSVLSDVMGNNKTISEAKIKMYDKHREDLCLLKEIIKNNCNINTYKEIFRSKEAGSYFSYINHNKKEEFYKTLKGTLDKIETVDEIQVSIERIKDEIQLCTFLPKQKDTNNRVIPNQLYQYELIEIVNNAKKYLNFLNEKEEGITNADKIVSIFKFKIPYFVGPLNKNSNFSWIERKTEGKIYPWNFEDKVDIDKSEEAFIKRMTNTCTYLPGEKVLPKDSLLYHQFMVLNEINNIRINNIKLSVEQKQKLYNNVFLSRKKVTRKMIETFLVGEKLLNKGEELQLTGIDIDIKSNLFPQISFGKLLEDKRLTEEDVERIIERSSYAEDKLRLKKWLEGEYNNLPKEEIKYICNQKIKGFGRLSRKFLAEIEGCEIAGTGEVHTIINALWNTQYNLNELLSDKFTFVESIKDYKKEYYSLNNVKLEDRLKEMYISNAVKRPVYRTLDVVKDVTKAFGEPKKIFVEMTREAGNLKKGKRTKSRKDQILELYKKFKIDDVKELKDSLESLGERCDEKLRGDKLFLYYMQLGKCIYSGKTIDLNSLLTKEYDIDHIYPQAYVKDDSIINNRVLCLSNYNGTKGDKYPVNSDWQENMHGFWTLLKEKGLMSDEKYKRLTRKTAFSEEEKQNFINRQIVETSQSTKAVATLLKENYPNTEIVYCKAGIVSDFRHEFDMLKSRKFNDLHHAKDAYLNIVTGNVYSMKFNKRWFSTSQNYSIKTKTIFSREVKCGDKIVWSGEEMIGKIRKNVEKNNANFTKYAFFKKGGLFDQNPLKPNKDLVPIKKDLHAEKYGGYNKSSIMFWIPVKYQIKNKTDILIMSVELMYGDRFLKDIDFARQYTKDRLKKILCKNIDLFEYPMGMRAWKVNTVLSLDGFEACITGAANKGKSLLMSPQVQFSSNKEWNYYIKKLERMDLINTENKNYAYDELRDEVTKEKNEELYDLYINKLTKTIYAKRINNPIAILEKGKDEFVRLNIFDQTKALLNIHNVFGRGGGGCDLSLIGGASNAAATGGFSSIVSNWKKYYSKVFIVDKSATSLWKKESENIFELL